MIPYKWKYAKGDFNKEKRGGFYLQISVNKKSLDKYRRHLMPHLFNQAVHCSVNLHVHKYTETLKINF